MTARRTSFRGGDDPSIVAVAEADLGGIGVDFDDVPDLLDAAGVREWSRLGAVFAHNPTRFRESDRPALTAYCVFLSQFDAAVRDVADRGAMVPGRSERDEGRLVKNASLVLMQQASTQVRYWARELALTPDSRGRTGIRDEPKNAEKGNPFA